MIDRAFEIGSIVWLGITTQKYLSSLPPHIAKSIGPLETYENRYASIEKYLIQKGLSERAKLVPIDDKFGTTLEDENLQAIVVSPETELTATEINLLRAQKNWPALEVLLVPWVLARDGEPIHSTRIRAGEIDREGNLYRLPSDWGAKRLPDDLREELKKPLGKLIPGSSDDPNTAVKELISRFSYTSPQPSPSKGEGVFPPQIKRGKRVKSIQNLISVGDAVTNSLVKNGVTPDISIIDLKIERKDVYKNVEELGISGIKVLKKAVNSAGTLNYDAYKSLLELIESKANPAVLQIEGEEDLLTLFAIFLAPLNSLIVYGQPTVGIVVVELSEEKKIEVKKMLNKFKVLNE